MDYILGIDLGGTNIKAVLTNPQGQLIDETTTPTEDHGGADHGMSWKQKVKEIVDRFRNEKSGGIKVVGMAAPGLANPHNDAIAYMPNKLIGLEEFVWKDFLEIDTYILNDAHAALVAESRMGAGKGYSDIVLLTLGTGIGGGIMIGGQLMQGQRNRAGHIGHISVNQNIDQSVVGMPGSVENAIGECTIKARTYGRFQSTKELVLAYQAGDTFASWVWLESVQQLARGVASIINSLSPELIILGGGIMQAGDVLTRPLSDFLEIYEWRPGGFTTRIVPAMLKGQAGAVGAAIFAHQKVTQ
ncbi:MAG: ROK family protein [Saprospiraceae bacterium]|nr:ROK family protein [Saprospiraceae bacterium]